MMPVICQICGAERKIIHNSHLKTHSMTTDEYRNMFPGVEMASQEYRDVISETQVGRKPWNTGKTRAEDPRIPQPWLGKRRSQETRDKISVIITELWKDPEYIKKQERTLYQRILKINRNRLGKTLEEIYGAKRGKELRQVWSDSHKGLRQSEETIAKRVAKISGEDHYLYGRHHSDITRIRIMRGIQKSRMENCPYMYLGVPFASKGEMMIAELLYHHVGFKPIEGENCHIIMNGGEIDFFLFETLFLEYHPWDRDLTHEQYYSKRRGILDRNGYEKHPLIVTKSFEETKKMLEMFL